jgi:hypothetical protein
MFKKAEAPTNSASGRSCPIVAETCSISRAVLALRTWVCTPMVRAAASTSRKVASVCDTLAGLTRTAIRMAPGTN